MLNGLTLRSASSIRWVISAFIFTCAFQRRAQAQWGSPRQLTFSISAQEGSCDRSVALYQGERLTLKFPQKVQVSVPSQDQLVKLFISGRLVVISPLDTPHTEGQKRLKFPSLSVTTELLSGETFICRFTILSRNRLREGDQPVELIRVISAHAERRREDEAIKLIQERLTAHNQTSGTRRGHHITDHTRLDRLLKHWRKRISEETMQQVFGASHLTISSATPLRAQEHLIYVTIERVMVSQDRVYLRMSLRNHSQERFNLHRIFYIPPDESRAMTLWSLSLSSDGHQVSLPPNGRARVMVIESAINILRSKRLVFEGEDHREVSLDLSELDELQ